MGTSSSLSNPLGIALVLVAVLAGVARADVKLPAIFGDHMVLQGGAKLPVWGTADPGESVTVTLGAASASTVAGADGSWRVDLAPIPQTPDAQVMTVTAKNTVTFQDVLIGDVWLASGQSNMQFGIHSDGRGALAVSQADEPQIRLFMVPTQTAFDPKNTLGSVYPDRLEGKWQVCSPAVLDGKWGWGGFPAVAYYFGREIHHVTGRPIGLIGSSVAGTPAQAWTSLAGLEKEPAFSQYIEDRQKVVDGFDQANAAYVKLKADFEADTEQWNTENGPSFYQTLDQWKASAAQASATGQPVPPEPKPTRPKPIAPIPPDGGTHLPATLFNGMIAPLIPYAIKGVIWYQGEQNAGNAKEYLTLFPRLIADWREKWGQGDFPFLYVQLANWGAPQKAPSEAGGWPLLREAQLKTLAVTNAGMATAIDVGDPFDLHPKDKLDVGLRLALAARRLAYGENLVASGPIYDALSIDGNKIRLTFKETGSGLTMGVPPWTPTGKSPPPPSELTGFAIAGEDRRWTWAQASIEDNAVVVSAGGVANPVAVRYDWAASPIGNLYNKEGLPASPFRTDDWDDLPQAPSNLPQATASAHP